MDWHSDGPHTGQDANWDGKGGSPPYVVCVFIPLIDLDPEVGFTQFWPKSHHYSQLIGFGPAACIIGAAVDGVIPAGGCVMYDYRLMHRGMPNRSRATLRPLIQLLYHKPSYKEKRNYAGKSISKIPNQVQLPVEPRELPHAGEQDLA
eukprot:gene20422-27207_t